MSESRRSSMGNCTGWSAAALLLVGFLGCSGSSSGEQPPPPPPPTHPLVVDLRAFQDQLVQRHPNPFFQLSKVEFEAQVAALEREVPSLDTNQFLARWQRLLGALGDEHTSVTFNEFSAFALPLGFQWAEGKLVVVQTDASHRDLRGRVLARLGGRTVPELVEALRPLVPHAMDGWFRHVMALRLREFVLPLQALGTLPGGPLACEFLDAQGGSVQRTFAMGNASLEPRTPLLRDQEPASNYFHRLLDGNRVLYVRYRRCSEMANPTMTAFSAQVAELLQAQGARRLILDLRGNPGGNSRLLDPFVQSLASSPWNAPDRCVVLIDAGVFSSGMFNAVALRSQTRATFLGEPVGQAYAQYGDVISSTLPSGRRVGISSKYFNLAPPGTSDPFHTSLGPDRVIQETLADVRADRDPVLEAALK